MCNECKECPCKGCMPPKRSSTCHGNCKEYLEWSTAKTEENERIRKVKAVNY